MKVFHQLPYLQVSRVIQHLLNHLLFDLFNRYLALYLFQIKNAQPLGISKNSSILSLTYKQSFRKRNLFHWYKTLRIVQNRVPRKSFVRRFCLILNPRQLSLNIFVSFVMSRVFHNMVLLERTRNYHYSRMHCRNCTISHKIARSR